ncbi:MAG TPA: acetate--CoA ligase family protein, partial [Gaiellaceae bacterium]|nr:acetate--CoA ligase family protein [Gaiellaceae bacterium]
MRLGLHGDEDVQAAAQDLLDAATPDDGAVGILVAPMVRGNRELIAGMHRDAQFGPCVMLGVGGVLAEALADVAFRLVPVDRVDAEELLDDLDTQALLGPV